MADFVVGESVLIDEDLSDFAALHAFFQVTEERAHIAPSVVVDQDGHPITPPSYVDRMGASHQRSGVWAFSRTISIEALGLLSGTQWIRDTAMYLMFGPGSPYTNRPHFYSQVYLQRFGDPQTHMLLPMSLAGAVAFSDDGSRLCTMEERLGHLVDGTGSATFVLWEYELALGTRRRIAGFPASAKLGFVELSYSPDGAFILVGDWLSQRSFLVRVADGLVVPLPIASDCVAWNPRSGSSALLAMTTDPTTGALLVDDFDLATGERSRRIEVRPPHGIPVQARNLAVSIDERALVTANIGAAAIDLLPRGGVQVVAEVDLSTRRIEPLLPVRFRTAAATRRHTSPRWCEDRAALLPSPTVLADQYEAAGRTSVCDPDPPVVLTDVVKRWRESFDGIVDAWESGRLPSTAFAQEAAQLAASCASSGEPAAVRRLGDIAQRDVNARDAYAWASAGGRHWYRSTALPEVEPHERPVNLDPDALAAVDELTRPPETLGLAGQAAQALAAAGTAAGYGGSAVWDWLAAASASAIERGEYRLAAKISLAAGLWTSDIAEALGPGWPGLAPLGESAATALFVSGFEACSRLQERHVLSRPESGPIDVENFRSFCQRSLSTLPLEHHLAHRRAGPGVAKPAPDPGEHARPRHEGPSFISYVHEDSAAILEIAAALNQAGIPTWVDKNRLAPGGPWRPEILRAIRECRHFVAFFSDAYAARDTTYMNDEIRLALSERRLMGLGPGWFIPVKLGSAPPPSIEVDSYTTLADLHYVDMSSNPQVTIDHLIAALRT